MAQSMKEKNPGAVIGRSATLSAGPAADAAGGGAQLMRGGALFALKLGSRGWGCPKESGSITGGVKVVTALFEALPASLMTAVI